MVEIKSPLLSPAERKLRRTPLSPVLFDAFLEGNTRVPQVDFGIGLFVLRGLLSSPDSESAFSNFRQSNFTEEQIIRLYKIMKKAHGTRNITVRSELSAEEYLRGRVIDLLRPVKVTLVHLLEMWSEEVVRQETESVLSEDSDTPFKMKGDLLNTVLIETDEIRSGSVKDVIQKYKSTFVNNSPQVKTQETRDALVEIGNKLVESVSCVENRAAVPWVRRVVLV